MTRIIPSALLVLALAACGSEEKSSVTTVQNDETGEAETVMESDSGWRLTASQSAGATALFSGPEGQPQLAIACPIRNFIEVTVAGAKPIASEERLTIGFGGGTAITLAAVPTIDRNGANSAIPGGMKATGPAPAGLDDMMQSGEIAINYGSQNFGPFPAFPNDVRQRMINEC